MRLEVHEDDMLASAQTYEGLAVPAYLSKSSEFSPTRDLCSRM